MFILFIGQTLRNYSTLGGRQMLNATSHPPISQYVEVWERCLEFLQPLRMAQ
jgi:hypothetical protein